MLGNKNIYKMNKVALIIIYNHQYNKNIEVLEKIYKNRFSDIYHLVPFYKGEKLNVIPVYESSYYFQGYVAQGFTCFFKEEYKHYFFIADDLLLNPTINDNNYSEYFNLNLNTCFIPGFISLDECVWWPQLHHAFEWDINFPGVEAKNQLPKYEVALQAFKKHGLEIKPLNFNQRWYKPTQLTVENFGFKMIRKNIHYLIRKTKNKLTNNQYNLPYPMVGSYSDIFIVSSVAIKRFCHYCGVFAATKLFVEIGLPTSLVLSGQEIVTEKDLKLNGKALWYDGNHRLNGDLKPAFGDYEELDIFNNNLKDLLINFPENYIYLHPIKLSKWNTET